MSGTDTTSERTAILIVDDEESVLRSLRRTLRRDGYEIHLALSGERALQILEKHDIALILCDQRMPGMSGAEVLAAAFERAPDTYRVTLTGYTDLDAAQRSINDGRVNQFLTKPWDDVHLSTVVRSGVNAYHITRENRRLQELTRRQKEQLQSWSQQLEGMVEKRTMQVRNRNKQLQELQEQLQHSLSDTVVVLASLLEAYDPSLGIHSKRMARMARRICEHLEVGEEAAQETEFAAYLHGIGLMSRLHRAGRERSARANTTANPRTSSAESGWAMLSRIRGFENVARAVRHQSERYDGTGRPEGLKGAKIPLTSRIIAVCKAYDMALHAGACATEISPGAAADALRRGKGKMLDPVVVEALMAVLEASSRTHGRPRGRTVAEAAPRGHGALARSGERPRSPAPEGRDRDERRTDRPAAAARRRADARLRRVRPSHGRAPMPMAMPTMTPARPMNTPNRRRDDPHEQGNDAVERSQRGERHARGESDED